MLTAMCSCGSRYVGIYSTCWEVPNQEYCEYIELREDGSFLYSNPYHVSGNFDTHGNWRIVQDTLVLNTDHKLYELSYNRLSGESQTDSVRLNISTIDSHGKKFDIGPYAEVSLSTKAQLFKPDSTGTLMVHRDDLTGVMISTVGVRQFWISDISRDVDFNELEILFYTEFMVQMIFTDEKWPISGDSIFIPTLDTNGVFSYFRIIERNKTNPNKT